MTENTLVDFARQYASRGMAVFPLHWAEGNACSCGDAECRSKAKHPLTPEGVKDASTDVGKIVGWWKKWPKANIGLALGGLVAVDTDPRNGGDVTLDTLQEEHGMLPDTWLAMTGGGGTHHVYKAREGVAYPGKLGIGVDLKRGAGAYIVVEPSKHISGMAYLWEASSSPLEGASIALAPEWLGEAAVATRTPGAPPAVAVSGIIPEAQAIEIRSALAFLDNDDRDVWLGVGMALHSTSATNAWGLWTEWSQHSAKYDAKDQKRVWQSFSNKPGKKNVEAIFAMAQRAGWVNPRSKAAVQFQDDVQRALDAVNTPSEIQVAPPAPEPITADFPVPVLNELARWIDSRYPLTHPDVTRQTVLTIAGLGASRTYVGDGGSPCHLCLGLVADSTILTAYARDAVSKVLDESGLRRMMRGTRANAPSNVYGTLWKSPAAVHVIADYGHMATFAKRQPSGVLDQTFSVMADAYTSSAIYVDSAVDAGLKPGATDDQMVVHSPALTMLLLSTKEQMGTLLQRGEISRGLLAYQLPVLVDSAGAIERTPSQDALPAHLRAHLRLVRRLPDNHGDLSPQQIFGGIPGTRPNLVRIRYANDFSEHATCIAKVSEDPEHKAIVLAAQQTARRLVNTMAAWHDPGSPVATREIMDWCAGYVIKHLKLWLEQYSTLGNEDGKADVGQKIVSAVTDRKCAGIPRSKLANFCRAFRMIRDSEKRSKLIDGLIEDGDLIEFTPEGTRTKVLVSTKFAKRVEKLQQAAQ